MSYTCSIRVEPSEALHARARLFGVLSDAYGIGFSGDDPDADAVVRFGVGDGATSSVTELLYLGDEQEAQPTELTVTLANDPLMDPLLGGRRLAESHVGQRVSSGPDAQIIANSAAGPLWVREGRLDQATIAPAELEPNERLRSRFTNGRFLGLLPLLELIRRVAPVALPRPELQATFIFDDPNLHWPSYGWVRYKDLAKHAEDFDYHVNISVIPLDCWHVSERVAKIFRSSERLSLSVHGNDHTKNELAVDSGPLVKLGAQAAARIDAVAKARDLDFDRVMVPPHGRCSPEMMDALLRTGWEGIAFGGAVGSGSGRALKGWLPADRHVGNGLAGLHRLPFRTPAEELALCAYLGRPLILYGHHEDLADGLEILSDVADRVRSLGEIEWRNLTDLARHCVSTREQDGRFVVTPFTRRVVFDVPPVVGSIVIEPLATADQSACFHLQAEDGSQWEQSAHECVEMQARGRLELTEPTGEIVRDEHLERRDLGPLIRRLATEIRDRTLPAVTTVRKRLTHRRR